MKKSGKLTMTIPEFAEAVGLSRGTAYALAKQNKLGVKVLTFGRRKCVSVKEVEALLSSGK